MIVWLLRLETKVNKSMENSHSSSPTRRSQELDNYEILRPIGIGAYGVVFVAKERKTGKFTAIKKVDNIFGDEKEMKK